MTDAMTLKWVDDGKTLRDPAIEAEENRLRAYNTLFRKSILAADEGRPIPNRDLLWRDRINDGVFKDATEPGIWRQRAEYYRARRTEIAADEQALFERQRVSRDPCVLCGVRGDIHHGKTCRQAA